MWRSSNLHGWRWFLWSMCLQTRQCGRAFEEHVWRREDWSVHRQWNASASYVTGVTEVRVSSLQGLIDSFILVSNSPYVSLVYSTVSVVRLEGLMDLYSQGCERSYTVNSSILRAIEPHLKDFQQLLLNPPTVPEHIRLSRLQDINVISGFWNIWSKHQFDY